MSINTTNNQNLNTESVESISDISVSSAIRPPIEFQVLPDGQVRLYCSNRGRIFNLLKQFNIPESQGQYTHFRTGSAWVAELKPSQILEISPYTSHSNWKKAVALTDEALMETTDKNYRPVSSKVFRQRMEKKVKELELNNDSRQLVLA